MYFPADTLLNHPLLHPPPCETTGEEIEIYPPLLLHRREGKGGGACWDAHTADLRRQP
jgi:hypothetical protein